MSIQHPTQKQIRLPFSVPKPGLSEATKRICGICRNKDSNYTCPRCNVAYCSLACFRDEKHAHCSEPFYKSTVLAEIASDPGAGQDEKRQMLDMLRRFEEGQAEGEESFAELEKEIEDEDELAKALSGVDLDNVDSNKLFHLLPQAHRDAFIKALRDPDSDAARALLEAATPQEKGPSILPWWERPEILVEDDATGYALSPQSVSDHVLANIRPPGGTGLKLAYNTLAIAVAYIHILLSFRLPSLNDMYLKAEDIPSADVKAEFGELLPFLSDPKSSVRYESARQSWSAIWENIGNTLPSKPTGDLLIRLLTTLSPMLHPPLEADNHPTIFLILSDVYSIFSSPKAGAAAPRKLLFYIAALRQLNRGDWLKLEKEVDAETRKLQAELEPSESDGRDDDRPALRI